MVPLREHGGDTDSAAERYPRRRPGGAASTWTPATVAALRGLRETQTAERWEWQDLWTDNGLVFVKKNGLP